MSTFAEEVAYCTDRVARSTALAEASTDSCARASHVGIAKAYGARLAALECAGDLSDQVKTPTVDGQRKAADVDNSAPSRLDSESAGSSHNEPSIGPDGELPHLRASVVALENVVVAILAGGSSDQRAAVHDMALFVQPLLGSAPDSKTNAAEIMDHLADRSALFASVRT